MVERLAVQRGQGLGGEVGIAVIRRQGQVQLGRPATEQRRPLEVRADQKVTGLELTPFTGEEAARRAQAELRILAVGQRLLEAVDQGVHDVVPPVVLVGDELLEDRHRGRRGTRRVGPVLDAPTAERGVGKTSPLAQEPPDLDPGVDPLLETADELDDGPVAEQDRAVRLLGGEGHGRVVLGQELVELPEGRGGQAEQLPPVPPTVRRRASSSTIILVKAGSKMASYSTPSSPPALSSATTASACHFFNSSASAPVAKASGSA